MGSGLTLHSSGKEVRLNKKKESRTSSIEHFNKTSFPRTHNLLGREISLPPPRLQIRRYRRVAFNAFSQKFRAPHLLFREIFLGLPLLASPKKITSNTAFLKPCLSIRPNITNYSLVIASKYHLVSFNIASRKFS